MRHCKFTGLPLPDNLYNDARGRPACYRYRTPQGGFRIIREPYAKAVAIAELANTKRQTSQYSSKSIRFWVDQYINWMELQNSQLQERRGWADRRSSLRKFSLEFKHIPLQRVTIAKLSAWWDELSYDQQHNRRSNYSQFFQWAMSKGAALENPFNNSDAIPHLIAKKKPAKMRVPINDMKAFWAIYEEASETIRIAMMISITTTMRAGDIASLTFDHIVDNRLCRTIAKSANQRGAMAATHLGWDLSSHMNLGTTIDAARELAQKHMRCPYIVSKRPQRMRIRKDCTHTHQCTSKDLSRGFTAAVKASGRWDDLPDGRTPPTFHEVRGLAIDLLLKAGIDIKDVQKLAAHTDESITSAYTAQHEPDYVDLGVVVTNKMLENNGPL